MLALRLVGQGEDHREVGRVPGRDEHLAAIDDPVLAVADGGCLHVAGRVGAAAGLCQGEAPCLLPLEDRPQPAFLLLRGATLEQWRRPHAVQVAADQHLRQLLADHDRPQQAKPRPAHLLGHAHPPGAKLADPRLKAIFLFLFDGLTGKHPTLEGHQLVAHEPAQRELKHA